MPLHQIKNLLDAHAQRILSGDAFDAVNSLSASMFDLRMGVEESQWRSACKPAIVSHQLYEVLDQDPYTGRARRKPRGYAGDAVMLDYLYDREPPPDTTPLGREIFKSTVSSPGADAVRWRLQHVAGRIDSLQRLNRTVRCLSLACGHLREAALSEAVRHRKAMIFAVDRDPRSLRVVSKKCSQFDVDTICASLLDILNGNARFAHLDLAYAAGLFDYLSKPAAIALTAKLFSMLDFGGVVIVPNFLSRNPVRGYMESFMDWNLIVRSREEILELGSAVPQDGTCARRYYEDPFGVIGYLELKKTG